MKLHPWSGRVLNAAVSIYILVVLLLALPFLWHACKPLFEVIRGVSHLYVQYWHWVQR